MRVAAIDIGTNTALLLIAESGGDGGLVAVAERATITRLGEGVDRQRRLAPAAVARTRACLEEYAALVNASGVGSVAVVGTSAMRDASGGEELRSHVRAAFGVDVRVLSGTEEARLTFRGALSGLALDAGREIAVVDVGGGSTEAVIGLRSEPEPVLRFARSYDVGSVRLTERFFAHDPPSADELEAARRSAADAFAAVPSLEDGSRPVGVAGTVTTLAAVALGVDPYEGGRVHGRTLGHGELRSVVERLAGLDVRSRREVRGMEPKRADVIVAGGIVLLALLERWGAKVVVVSDRGVRWGLAEELVRPSRSPVAAAEKRC